MLLIRSLIRELNHTTSCLFEVLEGLDGETTLCNEFLTFLFIRTPDTTDYRNLDAYLLVCKNDALCNHVTKRQASENVYLMMLLANRAKGIYVLAPYKDCRHVGICQNGSERVADSF